MTPEIEIPGLPQRVSKLALGTAGFGSQVGRDEAFALLDTYAEAGGNFLDTANVYAEWLPGGKGQSEQTIGAWLRARGARARTVIGTKGGHHDLATGRRRMNPRDLDHDLRESLDRLAVDRVDLYWFHRDDPDVPVGEIMAWAAAQITAGRIGAVGCSNWTLARLMEANEGPAAARSPVHFCANQVGWSLADRNAPPPELPDLVFMNSPLYAFHAQSHLPVVAYSSQAGGFFGPKKRADAGLVSAYGNTRNEARRAAVDTLAARRKAAPNQMALAWLWHHPFPVVPIVGPRTPSQLDDSLGALDLRLSAAEIEALSSPPSVP